jgi:Double zinc ribbon
MICPHCATDNPVAAKFCADCGGSLAFACLACGHGNPPESRFCNECGRPVGHASAGSPPSEPTGPRAYTPRHIAERILTSASALDGRFEVGRTRLDLAALAHAQGDREAAFGHLHEARMLFQELRAPMYVERTAAIAQEYGAPLASG